MSGEKTAEGVESHETFQGRLLAPSALNLISL